MSNPNEINDLLSLTLSFTEIINLERAMRDMDLEKVENDHGERTAQAVVEILGKLRNVKHYWQMHIR